jgi:glycosyltransferase involved in cell wall biosynthesis
MTKKVDKLISIIVPCYNNEAFVKEAIDSALHQTYPHVEIIVIDDGSKDRSVDILRSFGDKIQWESGLNQGAPTARNRGIALARGKYIKFLDADDILLPDCIERQLIEASALAIDRQAIVYGDALRIDRQGNPLPSYPCQPRQATVDPIEHILAHCPLTSCPLHQKAYLEAIGGFDPTLTRGQEHDLHLRLVLSGVEFLHYSHSVYQYREYSDPDRISNHAYTKKSAMMHYNAIEKHIKLIKQQTAKPLTDRVSTILAQRLWRYGRGVLREGAVTEANLYFNTARQLAPKTCIVGQNPYPILVGFFGTERAEALFSQLKNSPNWLGQIPDLFKKSGI